MSRTSIRQWHSYIGLFIGPSVLFFALTGAMQVFSLHEQHGTYRPFAVVEKLSSVHKDQVFALSDHHGPAAPEGAGNGTGAGAAPTPGPKDDDEPSTSTLILKGFFLTVALCLALSTAFGLWMGLTQTRQKRLAWVLVIVGAALPVVLLLL